jgi:hypothetical protein
MESRPKKLLDQVRDAIRVKHYARNTEQAYVYWIRKYILFHKAKQGFARHPKEMDASEVQAFLSAPNRPNMCPPCSAAPKCSLCCMK